MLWTVFSGAMGNMKEATRMGEVALRVLEASGAHEMLPRVYGVVYCWNSSLDTTSERNTRACEVRFADRDDDGGH